MKSILAQHSFQFVSFCDVYHAMPDAAIQIFEDYHLMHIIRGDAEITIDGVTYPTPVGSVRAVPPCTRYYSSVSGDFIMRNIHFRLWTANGKPVERRWILPFVFAPDYFGHTQELLEELCTLDCESPREQAKAAAIAHEIVLEHWVNAELQPSRPELIDHRIEQLHDILVSPEHLRRRYDAQELAHACHLSTSQMNRLFRRAFKSSPQKFWEDQRLAAIRAAFDTKPDTTIGEIAKEFGFEESSYFSRWFKERAGISPAAYRQQSATTRQI